MSLDKSAGGLSKTDHNYVYACLVCGKCILLPYGAKPPIEECDGSAMSPKAKEEAVVPLQYQEELLATIQAQLNRIETMLKKMFL